MPKFKFVALDPNGKTVSGNVESESEREATQLIEGKGYSVSTIEHEGRFVTLGNI